MVCGLSIRMRPVVLSWVGRILAASMIGVSWLRRSSHVGWSRASMLSVRLCSLAFVGTGAIWSMRDGRVALKMGGCSGWLAWAV